MPAPVSKGISRRTMVAAMGVASLPFAGCGGGASDASSSPASATTTNPPAPPPQVQPGDPGAFAAFIADMQPGEWRALPNSNLSQAYPERDDTRFQWGIVGPDSVMAAWGGGALDTKRLVFLFHGGGHQDYGGNEVYGYAIETMQMQRLTNPSNCRLAGPTGSQYVTDDGTPISAHTYRSMEYMPNVDRLYRNVGSEYRSGQSIDKRAWLFDPGTSTWKAGATPSMFVGGFDAISLYDDQFGRILQVTNASVVAYDPVLDKFTNTWGNEGDYVAGVGALDQSRRMILTRSYQPGLLSYTLFPDGSVGPRTVRPTTGAVECDKWPAFDYDTKRHRVTVWNGLGDVGYLTQWAWTRIAGSGQTAADYPYGPTEIYGRWRYIEKYDVFMGASHPRKSIWVWKPHD